MTPRDQFTLGVEEEYLIVDPATRAPSPAAQRLLDPAKAVLGDSVHTELQLVQIEASTPVCRTLEEVRDELTRVRRQLGAVAESEGLAIAAIGTHPLAQWRAHGRITPEDTYERIERDYQQLAREQLICGCHVHVGIDDREEAIQVLNRVRSWLSPLVAVTANSPFWMGDDTGYASYRTEVWRRWPTASTPDTFADRAEWDRMVETLVSTGSVDAPGRLYFDVRPSARYETLEFRVTDVCMTVDEAVMVTGLISGLVRTCHAEVLAGRPLPRPRAELLRAATWRAARHGLDADLIHVLERRALPARDMVAALLGWVRPALESAGEWDETCCLVADVIERGTGAARQRRAFERAGKLEDVVDLALAETAGSAVPRG